MPSTPTNKTNKRRRSARTLINKYCIQVPSTVAGYTGILMMVYYVTLKRVARDYKEYKEEYNKRDRQ